MCASASERVRRVCANIATVCDVDVALLPISLSLLLPLSFPDALNYLIIVRFFFCSFWLSLSLKHVFVCVCACVRVYVCAFVFALLFRQLVASLLRFLLHTHTAHTDLSGFVVIAVCAFVVVAFATWALCFGL